MSDAITALLSLADAWCAATGLSEATLSTRLLRDGKRLARIRAGADIGVRTISSAIAWLDQNWPTGLDWPEGVPRPDLEPCPVDPEGVG